jgi:hypothetical protein
LDQEKTYKWVQDRLRDLHSGIISDDDRIRLEEMAKSDPFIADAMEGYQAHSDQDHSPLLRVIAQRIQNKNAERRPKLLPLSRGMLLQAVAASFVLILATWAVIYYVQKQNDATLVAVEPVDSTAIEHSTEVELTYPDSSNGEIAGTTGTADELNDEPSGLRANAYAKAKAEAETKAKAEAEAKELVDGDDRLTISEPVTSAPAAIHPASDAVLNTETNQVVPETKAAGTSMDKSVAKKDEGYYANQMSPELMSRRIIGQVIEETGQPVTAAMVNILNTNLVTTTDDYGRFEFYPPEPSVSIEISNTGYKDTILSVTQSQQDLVIMIQKEDFAPAGGVLAGNETKAQTLRSESAKKIESANPPITFLEYLKTNSHYPIEDNYTPKSKSIYVEFEINSEGRPYAIKKINSRADNKYIAEAMRLVQNGPAWKCEGDEYPCIKKYTIYFK